MFKKRYFKQMMRFSLKAQAVSKGKPPRFIPYTINPDQVAAVPEFERILREVMEELGYVFRQQFEVMPSSGRPGHLYERRKLWQRDMEKVEAVLERRKRQLRRRTEGSAGWKRTARQVAKHERRLEGFACDEMRPIYKADELITANSVGRALRGKGRRRRRKR